MKNTLKIKNFLIFEDAEFEIKRFTVLIGEQASGKSIAAKLLYLFYCFPNDVHTAVAKGETKRVISKKMLEKFKSVFPEYAWHDKCFEITFETDHGTLSFTHEAGKALSFSVSKYYESILRNFITKYKSILSSERQDTSSNIFIELERYMSKPDWGMIVKTDKNIFIPAGRSFFSSLDKNVFTFLSSNIQIEYFLKEFGMYYERCRNSFFQFKNEKTSWKKDFELICKQLLHGSYFRKEQKDFIIS